MPQHRKKIAIRLQPQTLYHLHQMAAAAGYDRDIGRVVDKIVRAWLSKKEER